MERARRTRLRDIAEVLGLSVNSVSRALADKDNISEETKSRVRAEAQRLGYVPNSVARSLVTGASMAVGLILTNPSNPIYAHLIAAVENEAGKHGYSLLLATSQDTVEREAKAVEMLLQGRVDGVLVVPVETAYEHLERLRDAGVPIVLVNRDVPRLGLPYVGVDNFAGAYEATWHLIRLGHRRIAVVIEDAPVSSVHLRVEGFRHAMAEAKLEVDPSLVLTVGSSQPGSESRLWSPEGAYEVARGLSTASARPTAMFVTNDLFALGIYQGFSEAGVRVPEDVAVVGFMDFVFSRYLVPPLTTVRTPTAEIGATAVGLLLRQIQDPYRAADKILLPAELVVRRSCGSGVGKRFLPSISPELKGGDRRHEQAAESRR